MMKLIPLKNIIFSNALLAVMSLFFGYSFWYIATIHQTITTTITVPLGFSVTDDYKIIAPEKIAVTLKGTRIHLYSLDISSLAAHIDIAHLSEGNHGITIQEKNLFLPDSITIARYAPNNIMINVSKNYQELLGNEYA